METLHHLNHADVQDIAIKDAPRHNSATGYGGKIPTRYMLKLNKRWHRVYMMQYGNSGSPYVVIKGVDHVLRSETERALEDAARAPLNLSAKPDTKPVGIPTEAKPTKPKRKPMSELRKSILGVAVMPALAIIALLTGMAVANANGLPACNHEDGSGQSACFWDAQLQGNGLGTSVTHGFHEAAAWGAWDMANAESLVTHPGAYEVRYEAHNTVGWTLTESNEISVTDGFGNYYLFTVHAR